MLEKVFKLKENHTDVKTEILAGITTFMTMAYILAVNPSILSAAGMDQGAVFTATYSLNMKDQLSTVAQEINHLKNYCYVMSVRMQDNIEYVYDIDESLLKERIPRISIQPLVENALNHGLRNKRGEKKVQIRIKRQDENLVISVRDNGMGMDAEQINESLQKNEMIQTEKGSSIGLYNINARVKILYGDQYGIHIESAPGEGTCVFIVLPAEKKGRE